MTDTAKELEARMTGRTVAFVYTDLLGGVHLQFEDGGMADFNPQGHDSLEVNVDFPAPPRPPIAATSAFQAKSMGIEPPVTIESAKKGLFELGRIIRQGWRI